MFVMHPAVAPSPPCGQVRSRLTPPRRDRFGRLCHYRNCVGFGVGSCRFPPSSSGLDPGSTAALRSWTPDQVRGDDDGKIIPVAKRWGGGPSPQAMRSEEHTPELKSLMRLLYAVFCLKNITNIINNHLHHY